VNQAGAGSIMHHLASFGGKQPSLFQKAVIQSPANRPQYDRKGAVEDQYKTLEDLAGCKGQGLACLRKKDAQIIRDAAEKIMAAAPPGEYGFGPAVDGTFSRQLPDLEFASGE
jgi:carboxylesterase type B